MNVLDEIRNVLDDNDSFLIAGHINPDGDAIGSCLGLALALSKAGKKVKVFLEPYGPKFNIIPGKNFVISNEALAETEANVFIALDCGDLLRLGPAASKLAASKLSICIDHHVSNKGLATIDYIVPEASSTCELIYFLLKDYKEIDAEIATALYSGLVTDTGGFRHSSTSPTTYRIAAELLETGIDFTTIYNELENRHSEKAARAFGHAMRKMTLIENDAIAYSYFTYGDMAELKVAGPNLDGIAEYMLNTNGVQVSVLLYEKAPELIKVSMRSKEINVSEIAVEFNGGGHAQAAGCTLEAPMGKAVEIILTGIKKRVNG